MKTLLLLPLLLAAPAFAGTSAKQVVAPAPDPCLTSWFAGASVGYLTELEEPMYNIHLGVTNSCWTFAGWNTSLFLEVGYTDTDYNESWSEGLTYLARYEADLDVTIVPITANIKFDHNITGNLNAYIGGGVGVAYVDADLTLKGPGGSIHASDSDWVFAAQIFAGLSYSVSPNCEIYTGARWIYLADTTYSEITADDWLIELGARFKF